jgi:1-deoxy-D-xylulose-5-phosphate reductoisomerase
MDELPHGAASSIDAVMAQDALARAAAERIIAALPEPEMLGQTRRV